VSWFKQEMFKVNFIMLTNSVFLYSKYSESCNNIKEGIAQLSQTHPMKFLCVDNEKVRRSVINSKIQVKYVPCILNFYQNGTVEKYEGSDAFEIVEEYISQLYSQSGKTDLDYDEFQQFPNSEEKRERTLKSSFNNKRPKDVVQRTDTKGVVQRTDTKGVVQRTDTTRSDLPSMSNEKKRRSVKESPITKRPSAPKVTSIEDLDTEDEEDEDEILTDPIVTSNNNLVIPDRPDDPTVSSKSQKSIKQNGIMEAAMKMQKLREQEENATRRPQNVVAR
jgi:hypothetical protein